jgi:LysR family transcriptional regulator, pca operon transcriptional activator
VELDDFRIFQAVVQHQSISRAAASLHMGQPSVSQRILALEREVGKPLFTRHRRGVRLTEAGEVFSRYAERVLALVEEGSDAVRHLGDSSPRVTLSGPPTINGYLLPRLLDALARQGCHVTLHDAHSHEVVQRVLDGQVDVGFIIGGVSQPGVRRLEILHDPIVCVAAASHPLAQRRRLQLADLSAARIVLYRYSHDFHTLWDQLQMEFPDRASGYLETAPVESVKALLCQGEYVSFVPRLTIRSELEQGVLAELPVADLPLHSWTISMIWRDKKRLGESVRAVLAAASGLWPVDIDSAATSSGRGGERR